MKRFVSFSLLAAGMLAVFSACTDKENVRQQGPVIGNGEAGDIITGLGVVTSLASSRAATAGAAGRVQADSTLVAITMNSEGVITVANLDVAQTRVDFDAQGQITTDLSVQPLTKLELGEAYNMRGVSPIGKEYFEQAGALASWAVGRTSAEFVAMPLQDGRPADADLAASVTITVQAYIDAMRRAQENVRVNNTPSTYRTGLGVFTDISGSRNATAERNGEILVYSHYAMVTLDENNVIVAAWVDKTRSPVAFNAQGALVTDVSVPVPSGHELGNAYGMRGASPIGKEWYEQMEAFSQWMIGKTPAQVAAVAGSDGYPANADLTAQVTISVDPALKAVARAVANAR